jgi:TRAP-type mannitol/chloroaromatic compound transport system permease small subunit
MPKQLLLFAGWVDQLNDRFGVLASWLVLIAVLISAGNAMIRYSFSLSSNAWLEVQWYLFAGMVMLGAATTFASTNMCE